jgi:predicted phosphodiesterase
VRERHLIISDTQVPDTDYRALHAIQKFVKDFKPTHVWFNGDMLNATPVASYTVPADYHISLMDEIKELKVLLRHFVSETLKVSPEAKFYFLEGNHERRLIKYINNNAPAVIELEIDGERVLTFSKILELKKLNIKWINYWDDEEISKDTTILHGTIARIKSGYTAQAYIDKYGKNVVAGHCHRLALVFRTQGNTVRFGMETGSLCNRKMKVPYVKSPDWQSGFGIIQKVDETYYPQVIPIINHAFIFGKKIYSG